MYSACNHYNVASYSILYIATVAVYHIAIARSTLNELHFLSPILF